jgi:FtsP/CotA-like multicopper oxidase with cupredoxin domain
MTPDGQQSPSLHVRPGDELIIHFKNELPASNAGPAMQMPDMAITSGKNADCQPGKTMDNNSVNIHYHGTNVPPVCHQDEVINTLVNTGESFEYHVHFPSDEPPGLYWYHPHVHGISEPAVQGGASGAIIVDGVQNLDPSVAGLRHRVLLIRDQNVAGNPTPGGSIPSWDLSLNYIPISYPDLTPAVIRTEPGVKEFWRIGNLGADTILDVVLLYDGVEQPLEVTGIDGVPVGSQDGSRQGKIETANHLRIPPAGRFEVIVTTPPRFVNKAVLVTRLINTGPDGDNDTRRIIATIDPSGSGPASSEADAFVPAVNGAPWQQRFEGLAQAPITAHRKLYFSENNPLSQFFITVDGQTPTLFSPNNPPAITTHQGSVEEWTIENRTLENHEFHLHQVHFQVLSQNNFEINGSKPAPAIDGQFADMVEVPFWDGNPNHPFPSVKVLVDFRGQDIGDFVYHCHILEHEDGGMMAIIRVLP